jgi:hypothetical protein
MEPCAASQDLEVDDDFAGLARLIFNLDIVPEMFLQLLQQRQWVVVIAEPLFPIRL